MLGLAEDTSAGHRFSRGYFCWAQSTVGWENAQKPLNQKEAGECCNGSIKHPCGTVHHMVDRVMKDEFERTWDKAAVT